MAQVSVRDVLLPDQVDISKLTFGAVKQLNNGGRTIYPSYGTGNLVIQTPPMRAPFGVRAWTDENAGPNAAPPKYDVAVSFDGADGSAQMRAFLDSMTALDKRMVQEGFQNSQQWFRKKHASPEVVEALYTPCVKTHKDRDTGEVTNLYPPTLKLSLPTKDGKFLCPVYNEHRQEVDLMELVAANTTKGATVQAIIQLSSVWMVGTKFGLTWRVKQLKITAPAQLTGYAFRSTDEDKEEDTVAFKPDEDSGAEVASSMAGLAIKKEARAAAAVADGAGKARVKQEPGMLPDSDEEDPLA